MRWHVISRDVERSACGRYTIRWHPCGFGIWAAEVWVAGKRVRDFVSAEHVDAGTKARTYCADWGHLVNT